MIKSKNRLAFVLKTDVKSLNRIISTINRQYSYHIEKTIKYNGKVKERLISNPSRILKRFQELILKNILQEIPLPNYLHGGVKGKSNITNAKRHQGKNFHFCTDIRKFYPSISSKRVLDMFLSYGFHFGIASTLTKLTTINGNLPQGAPTSTYLANLVFLNTDKQLVDYCNRNGIVYTRFVDDLTFSSQTDFKDKNAKILEIVANNGFVYHQKKTFYKKGPVEITGVLTKQNKLRPTDAIIKKLEQTKIRISKKGLEDYINRINNT